jgi:chloramphenicol 3-O-phosphotransferase
VPIVALFGGPAGAGKTTLAAAWCSQRERAVHIELDDVRSLIVSGLADPQDPSALLQARQYDTSVDACCALARVFAHAGYDIAIGDVLEPKPFERLWRPRIEGLDWRLLIVLPSLDETLARSRLRTKRVLERHTRDQHAALSRWPITYRVDTTGLTVEESIDRVVDRIDRPES